MTVSVATIITAARRILQDTVTGELRWSDVSLTDYVNDAQVEIVKYKPDANSVSASVALSQGPEQVLPADALRLIRVLCNMGVSGTTPGRSVLLADIAEFSVQNPLWMSDAKGDARFYMCDPADPKRFYISPPSNGTYAKIIYGARPATATTNITIPDEFKASIVFYVCYRAFLEDGLSPDTAKSDTFFQYFMNALNSSEKAERQIEPFGGVRNASN